MGRQQQVNCLSITKIGRDQYKLSIENHAPAPRPPLNACESQDKKDLDYRQDITAAMAVNLGALTTIRLSPTYGLK